MTESPRIVCTTTQQAKATIKVKKPSFMKVSGRADRVLVEDAKNCRSDGLAGTVVPYVASCWTNV